MDPVPTITTHTPPLTEDAFFADRLRFWETFTFSALIFVIFVVLLIVGMAIFLL